MANKATPSNPNNAKDFYIITNVWKTTGENGEHQHLGVRRVKVSGYDEKTGGTFEMGDIIAIQEVPEANLAPEKTLFVNPTDDCDGVQRAINTLLEASIVNSKQLEALKNLIAGAFSTRTMNLWSRIPMSFEDDE